MRGQAAWEALQAAMFTTPPLCLNDERFTADELAPGDEIELRETCGLCSLFSACDLFARESRSPGWWAGRRRK